MATEQKPPGRVSHAEFQSVRPDRDGRQPAGRPQTVLPLPGGEGRGEGESHALIRLCRSHRIIRNAFRPRRRQIANTSGINASIRARRFAVAVAFAVLACLVESPLFAAPASSSPHWSFQPPADVAPPTPRRSRWVQSPIDAFILAKLEAARLSPAPPADKPTLLRRVTFDLIGLPPTPAELEAFLADDSPDAFAKVVDRLLASPHYGERWGRHWLDVARYADSNGQDENKAMAHAWRYRDYVIQAFNQDKPFDLFIREQLAGDLLPPTEDEKTTFGRHIATGFLVLGPKMLAEQDKPKLVMDIVDEQIDVVSRAFLGLTVSCSRCHDHKTDPIATRDYYALAGIFKSTKTMGDLAFVSKWNERPVATREERALYEAHVKRTNEVARQLTAAVREAEEAVRARWQAQAGDYLTAALLATDGELAASTGRVVQADSPLHRPTLDRWFTHLTQTRTNPAASPLAPFLPTANDATQRSESVRRLTNAIARISSTGSDLSPTAPRFRPGRIGPGMRCTGNNFVAQPHTPELEPAQLTIEAWVLPENPAKDGETRRWLVNKNENEWVEGHYALMLDGLRPGAYLNIGGGPTNTFAVWSDGAPIPEREWSHLAFSYDGHDLRLFVNGQPAGKTSVNRPRMPGKSPVHLGRRQDGYNHFTGGLDEAAIYRRALTTSEIAERFRHPEGTSPDDLIQRWTFDPATDLEREQWASVGLQDLLFGPDGLLAPPQDKRPHFPSALAERITRLEGEQSSLRTNAPPEPAVALAVEDGTPGDVPVHIRGSHLSLGQESIPRGFLPVLSRTQADSTRISSPSSPIPTNHSGRLELADWLTQPEHPLTARVTVNRIWQAHFGEGLVRSPDNFGVTGERPSHPELLDWLARQFIQSGWSVKRLHRLLLLSSTYQMSTAFDARAAKVDPENRLLWRTNRRRLEAEPLRDALLAIAGQLDRTMGGSLVAWRNADYTPDDTVSAASKRRAVYLPVVRDRVYDVFTIFDFANPSVGVGKRTPTVVSHQALFFLNSPFVKEQSRHLAEALLALPASTENARVVSAYQQVLSRHPTRTELERANDFFQSTWPRPKDGTKESTNPDRRTLDLWAAFCQALFASNEFLYVN